MIATLRRLHTWAGLFAFTSLLVMAAAGLDASARAAIGETTASSIREVDFRPDPSLDDARVGAALAARFGLTIPEPPPRGALRRNDAGDLELRLDTVNGTYQVTLLEAAGTARIEHRRNSLGEFLTQLHAHTAVGSGRPWPLRLWALYVDVALAALLFLLASGVAMWLATRPGVRWARALVVASVAAFVGLWWAIR